MSCAMIARFYGFGLSEIQNMTMVEMSEYLVAMRRLKAQEQLNKIEVATYSKVGDRDRNKIRKRLQKELSFGEKKNYIAPKEIARMLQDGR